MKIAVRYYSRGGNTKFIAEQIAEAAGVEAVSVDATGAKINENIDMLFIGGGLYAYGLDKKLKNYLNEIDGSKIGKAVCFSTSSISKHAEKLIISALEEKGIEVIDSFYCKGKAVQANKKSAQEFTKKLIN